MTAPDAALARQAAHQHSLATTAQALACGLTSKQLEQRVDDGVLVRLHHGVYHFAAAPFSARTRLLAAVLAVGPSAVASHRSAGALHGLDGVTRWRPELTVVAERSPIVAGVLVHRSDQLPRVDMTVVDRVPTTTVARTLLDLGAVTPVAVVEHAAQAAIIERKVSEIDLVCLLERLGGKGRRGTAALRAAVLAGLPPEELQSRLEWMLLQVVRSCPVEPPVLQHEVELSEGRRAVLDMAWPERMVAAEADGRRWHSTRKQFEADLRRSNALQALGWAHYRYGWDDARNHADGIRIQLLEVLRRRAA